MLVETFSLLNIVESGKYSRGNSDSKPGFQAPYSAGCCSIVIAHAPVVGSFQANLNFQLLANCNSTKTGGLSVVTQFEICQRDMQCCKRPRCDRSTLCRVLATLTGRK